MDDVTDTVFRRVIAELAKPDLFFTEFVNVDGLQSPGRETVIKRLRFSATEQPLIAQIWGLRPENFYKTAKELVDMGFSGVDLNFGCPEKAVVKNGACIALVNNRELAGEIIASTKAGIAGRIPLSVKTRLGFNEIDFTWHKFLLEQGLDMLTVHGRTRKELSKVPAHWDEIGKVRQLRDDMNLKTLIVGNGDVVSREQGERLAKKYKLDGIMIGRGVFSDPFVFAPVSPWSDYSKEQRIALYTKQVKLFKETWKENERSVHVLNKFCKVYINGYDGAKDDREKLMRAGSAEELLTILSDLLS